ncbi:MFS transporter [Streptomyces sp. H27-D2]|uniref:MFS transporter n=1 Tax=Streptomyces sp. H27-D2 TaxID=3046304 RepID=UPI002DB87A1F|nr:MFS transporter [Streptomyces sp. H27-D2]MEC4015400.1 MFS transporter [Streptomyces sp. H27-D2]
MAMLLVCSGAGGILGTQLSGRLVDRYDPPRCLVLASSLFCGAMLAFALLWLVRPVPVALVAALLACWSAAAWAVPPGIQALMLVRVGHQAAAQAMAVHSSSVYVGAAAGGALGGAVVALEPGLLPVIAAALVALGLLLTFRAARFRTTPKETVTTEGERV